jgi:hypothetical protein
MFMEQSGLELVQPDVDISFSSPAGYLQLLDHARLTATAVYDIRHPRRLFRRERRELRRAAKGLPTVDQELVPAGS